MTIIATRIQTAITNTRRIVPGYFDKCLAQRSIGQGEGSGYHLAPAEIEKALLSCEWVAFPHPEVKAPCVAFQAALPGRFGLVELHTLDPFTKVTLADYKGTGTVSPVVCLSLGPTVPTTTIILGPHEGEEIVYTFHPGDPIPPSTLQAPDLVNQTFTAVGAMALGFVWAKIA